MPRQEYTDRGVLITNNAMSGLMGCATREENVGSSDANRDKTNGP